VSHRTAASVAVRLSRLVALMAPEWSARQLRRPVLLIGCGRSGSTFLHQVLAAHPEIAAYPSEANRLWLPGAYPWEEEGAHEVPLWRDPRGFSASAAARRPAGWAQLLRARFGAYQRLRRKPTFLNKSVMVHFMLPDVRRAFPEARFVHLYRDGRAVAFSYARRVEARKPDEGASDGLTARERLLAFGRYWADSMIEIDAQRESAEAAGHPWLELGYEELCRDPRPLLDTLCRHLGVDPRPLVEPDGLSFRNMNRQHREHLDENLQEELRGAASRGLALKGYAESGP
jgi:LPS sulfotransferase NodH